MKDIILRFNSEEDYKVFTSQLDEDVNTEEGIERNEFDTSIVYTFEDSQVLDDREKDLLYKED